MLAEIGAFASFGYERREALWQVEKAVRPAGELFQSTVDSRQSTVESRVPVVGSREWAGPRRARSSSIASFTSACAWGSSARWP